MQHSGRSPEGDVVIGQLFEGLLVMCEQCVCVCVCVGGCVGVCVCVCRELTSEAAAFLVGVSFRLQVLDLTSLVPSPF